MKKNLALVLLVSSYFFLGCSKDSDGGGKSNSSASNDTDGLNDSKVKAGIYCQYESKVDSPNDPALFLYTFDCAPVNLGALKGIDSFEVVQTLNGTIEIGDVSNGEYGEETFIYRLKAHADLVSSSDEAKAAFDETIVRVQGTKGDFEGGLIFVDKIPGT